MKTYRSFGAVALCSLIYLSYTGPLAAITLPMPKPIPISPANAGPECSNTPTKTDQTQRQHSDPCTETGPIIGAPCDADSDTCTPDFLRQAPIKRTKLHYLMIEELHAGRIIKFLITRTGYCDKPVYNRILSFPPVPDTLCPAQ